MDTHSHWWNKAHQTLVHWSANRFKQWPHMCVLICVRNGLSGGLQRPQPSPRNAKILLFSYSDHFKIWGKLDSTASTIKKIAVHLQGSFHSREDWGRKTIVYIYGTHTQKNILQMFACIPQRSSNPQIRVCEAVFRVSSVRDGGGPASSGRPPSPPSCRPRQPPPYWTLPVFPVPRWWHQSPWCRWPPRGWCTAVPDRHLGGGGGGGGEVNK